MKYYLAIDLGATSGRHVIGYKDEKKEVVLQEVHRFKTGVDKSPSGFVWNIPRIFDEIVEGIRKALKLYPNIESLAIDSWGVDYVLLDKDDQPIPPFYAYRNERLSKKLTDEVHSIISFEELYKKTGIQFTSFNTIYQLYADKKEKRFEKAKSMLMLPEYFSFLLTGNKVREYTNGSTTGLINLRTNEIDEDILNTLGLPLFVKEKFEKPGYIIGKLTKQIEEKVGGNCEVIMCASHDSASAYEAVDTKDKSVIISSGTWSVLGIKSKSPISTKKAFKANFTNEAGPNYIRFLKNIMGMWIINNIAKENNVEIVDMVKTLEKPDKSLVFDVNGASLLNPPNMTKAVTKLIGDNALSLKQLFEATYYSLAICYKKAIEELEEVIDDKIENIYIVGGGAKNAYLNELVEEVTKRNVIALPIEATSLGNIKVQMKAK